MAVKEFLAEIDADVQALLDPAFDIEVVETEYVPSFDDPDVTFDNLDESRKSCKLLESCVLYVDIRDSAKLSSSKRHHTLARTYSAFLRSMILAARYFDGHVRNIIGDRVMVVFDRPDCFKNAVDTAVLFNTIAKHIINKHSRDFTFKCGIGIDFGRMLIVKAGTIRRGAETEFYRSLVWLGTPANVASRLTDHAGKSILSSSDGVHVGLHYPLTDVWHWRTQSIGEFVSQLEFTFTPTIRYKDQYFASAFATTATTVRSYSPILMTETVYSGLKAENPEEQSLKRGWWSLQPHPVRDYTGRVYGGDVIFTEVHSI